MIIRSQNKKFITTKLDLSVVEIAKRYEIIDNNGNTVATYSTEEKAIKVLDMIQNAYLQTTEVHLSENTIGRCLPRAVVFQMPQDSEV